MAALTTWIPDLGGLPKASVINTIERAGNGRAFYRPRLGGVQWRKGAVGNARFEGPLIRDLFRFAEPGPAARHVAFAGLDTPPSGSQGFIRRFWEYNWTPPAAGNDQLMCRAADMDGNRQPFAPKWSPGGYLWNGIDRINVSVRA